MSIFSIRLRFLLAVLALVVSQVGKLGAGGPPTPRANVSPPPESAPAKAKESAPSPGKAARDSAAATRAAPVANDATIEHSIQARFARSKISSNGFTVHVQNGVAVLEGKTSVIQHKGTATRLAKLGGARRVDNRIQISEAARQRAVANLAKANKN